MCTCASPRARYAIPTKIQRAPPFENAPTGTRITGNVALRHRRCSHAPPARRKRQRHATQRRCGACTPSRGHSGSGEPTPPVAERGQKVTGNGPHVAALGVERSMAPPEHGSCIRGNPRLLARQPLSSGTLMYTLATKLSGCSGNPSGLLGTTNFFGAHPPRRSRQICGNCSGPPPATPRPPHRNVNFQKSSFDAANKVCHDKGAAARPEAQFLRRRPQIPLGALRPSCGVCLSLWLRVAPRPGQGIITTILWGLFLPWLVFDDHSIVSINARLALVAAILCYLCVCFC